jgi:predicted PilT family ATPase
MTTKQLLEELKKLSKYWHSQLENSSYYEANWVPAQQQDSDATDLDDLIKKYEEETNSVCSTCGEPCGMCSARNHLS